jgi:hypothetical protein
MKRFAPAFTLSVIVLLPLNAKAQNHAADSTAVRATVTNYIEAYWTGDPHRMEQTLHPHYLKHMIHGDIPVREKTGPEMVKEVAKNGPADFPAASKTEQVEVLDVAGSIASAKLVTPGWTDYMMLEKIDGQWKILSVVQRIDN